MVAYLDLTTTKGKTGNRTRGRTISTVHNVPLQARADAIATQCLKKATNDSLVRNRSIRRNRDLSNIKTSRVSLRESKYNLYASSSDGVLNPLHLGGVERERVGLVEFQDRSSSGMVVCEGRPGVARDEDFWETDDLKK